MSVALLENRASLNDGGSSEADRLCALERYDLLDTPQEESFDRFTRLACRIFDVPISTITLLDGHRQWFKSYQGIDFAQGERRHSFCHLAVLQGAPLVIENALDNPRFKDNPLVTGAFGLRFYAGAPLRSLDGHDIGAICVIDKKPRQFGARDVDILTDLAQLVMSELEWRTAASTDPLTGALSRRAFQEEASRAIALARRHRHDISALMIDVDHFKAVNDTFGHIAGDRVLSEVMRACQSKLRASDLVGRLGGEEFAVLLPHTARAEALAVAELLRSAIAQLCVKAADRTITTSASIGVAGLDRSVNDVATLIERADAALYAAKSAGRNRCHLWESPVVAPPPDLRRRVLKAGRIAFNSGRSTIDCTVRALSSSGASIDFISTASVPDRFKLHILADEVHRACQVSARRDGRVEVDFL